MALLVLFELWSVSYLFFVTFCGSAALLARGMSRVTLIQFFLNSRYFFRMGENRLQDVKAYPDGPLHLGNASRGMRAFVKDFGILA